MTDIVEQAARRLYEAGAPYADSKYWAQKLADAGLLRDPDRTVPTREQIAEAILMVTQAENIDPAYAWDFQFLEVQDELLAQADAVLALMADQPTVNEVKAQALEEASEQGTIQMPDNPYRTQEGK